MTEPTWKEVRDYLHGRISQEPTPKVPTGAMMMPWQALQAAPKDPYNEVYPGIVLGDYSISRDKEKLTALGITHVVNCANGTKFNQINTDQEYFDDVNIKFHGIRAMDIMTFKMTPHLEPAALFIEEALGSGGKVYVHCQSGVSRSAMIVLAFLMLKRDMHLMDAVKTIRDKRNILPNEGFIKQLTALNDQLYSSEKESGKPFPSW